jgi:hypothetical protein
MPSISDVYNQLQAISGKLDQIHADGVAEITATQQVKTSVDTLDGDVKAGFAATVHGLQVIAQIEIAAVQLLFHLTQQTDTMICALEHISKNTCGILTQVTIQTGLQTRLRDDADALHDIAESVYPAGALERARLAALRAQVERCCPPEQPKPACTYEPCRATRSVEMPDLPKIGNDATPQ